MGQNQHVIAEWLLKLFSRTEPGGLTLSVYDKRDDTIKRDVPSRFSAILDDHSGIIEAELGRIESDAAEPVRRLVRRVTAVTPGLWPLHGATDNLAGSGAYVPVASPEPSVRLLGVDRWLAAPAAEDRRRISRYLTLMFTRSPKMEQAIAAVAASVRGGFVALVNAEAPTLLPKVVTALDDYLSEARFVGLRTPDALTDAFASMDWYLLRAADGAPFILGDSPVVSTIQLGHDDDSWRPLLSPATYAVCMPLASEACLLVAPQGLVPVGVASPEELAAAVNRLSWRWADRWIIAPRDQALSGVRGSMAASTVASTLPMDVEPEKAYLQGILTAWKVLDFQIREAYACIRCWPRYAKSLRPPGM